MSFRSILVLTVVLGTACAPGGEGVKHEEAERWGASRPVGSPSLPAEIVELGIKNARMPAPDLLTGGQLTREQMIALRRAGYRTFISLRQADEAGAGWEEEFTANEGIAFERIPVAGAPGVVRENAERLAGALDRAGTGPTALYCGSGNRVGALIALKAHLVDGAAAEEALALGVRAGLTRLEPVVREKLGLSHE